jgi:hypothetical protein
LEVTIIYATSSFYEILLIVLVLILIFNGLLRRKVLRKYNDSLSQDDGNKTVRKKVNEVSRKVSDEEYIDYEIIND